jgi:hypothetical protein
MVSSNNKIVLSRFFEQSNFEQMIMTQKTFGKSFLSLFAAHLIQVFISIWNQKLRIIMQLKLI